MIVPTYTATAKNVTGVSGQAMGFKIPGGALSQGQVAQAQLYSQGSDAAASFGKQFYAMHRSAVIGKQVAAATTAIDAAQIEASKKDVLSVYPDKTPGGYFANQAKIAMAKATAGSSDPITQSAIASQVSGLISTGQRQVNKTARIGVVQSRLADMSLRERWLRDRVSVGVPEGWDGDLAKLTPEAQEHFDELGKMRTVAAQQGLISYLDVQKGAEADNKLIGKLAVSKRMIAAETSQESAALLVQLRDGKSWRMLDDKDRDALEWRIHRQVLRQQNQEAAVAKQSVIAANKAEKKLFRDTADGLQRRILQARNNDPGAVMPTPAELYNAPLTVSARAALSKMALETTPSDTDADYFLEIHKRLRVIETNGLTPGELEEATSKLQEEIHAEVAKKHGSKINSSDALAFSNALRAAREKKGHGKVLARIEKDLRLTLQKSPMNKFISSAKLPALYNAIAKATRVLYSEGGTAVDALNAGLGILEFDKGTIPYPVALPPAAELGVGQSPEDWKRDEYNIAFEHVLQFSEFRSARERDDTFNAMKEILEFIEGEEAKAAAAAAAKVKKP